MKFTLAIAAISAIRLEQKSEVFSQVEKRGDGPSAKQIIDTCDTDNSKGLTKEEAHACIDAHITDPEENKEAHEAVDEGFDEADKDGNGEVDRKELRRAMRKHRNRKNDDSSSDDEGPSAREIMETCDTDNSKGLTKEEAHACIDAHITDPVENEEAHEAVDEGFDDADKDGSGEVDRKELRRAMRKHRNKK